MQVQCQKYVSLNAVRNRIVTCGRKLERFRERLLQKRFNQEFRPDVVQVCQSLSAWAPTRLTNRLDGATDASVIRARMVPSFVAAAHDSGAVRPEEIDGTHAVWIYWHRSAAIGSTRSARQAGIAEDSTAIPTMTPAALA